MLYASLCCYMLFSLTDMMFSEIERLDCFSEGLKLANYLLLIFKFSLISSGLEIDFIWLSIGTLSFFRDGTLMSERFYADINFLPFV